MASFTSDNAGHLVFCAETLRETLIRSANGRVGVDLLVPRPLIGDGFKSKVKRKATKPEELAQFGNTLRK